ncbi:MAG: hypothetical protein M1309_05150 [Actinobacteria bacterium]|nr:hypothetical protein [Actinomycetota bacterium]
MPAKCPGGDIDITIKTCPKCGGEVELFTGDAKAKCPDCGQLVYREKASCIEWCPGARQCFRHVFKDEDREKAAKGE